MRSLGVSRERKGYAAEAKFPAGDDASWGDPISACHSKVGRFGPAREEIAMRDPSLVAAKADIRQHAIKGGDVPEADIEPPHSAATSPTSRPVSRDCLWNRRHSDHLSHAFCLDGRVQP
jgi:hypothetical protein